MPTDRQPESPYGIICEADGYSSAGCGKQGLTKENYEKQMNDPDARWKCPICRHIAAWDDERYEAAMEAQNQARQAQHIYPHE